MSKHWLVVLLAIALSGCAARQKPAGCTEKDELAIDAWYQAELALKCGAFTPVKQPEQCPDYLEVKRQYQKKSEEWYVRCHP